MFIICYIVFFFFFQAEDGIRDRDVTGVQTCALPIFKSATVEALNQGRSHIQDVPVQSLAAAVRAGTFAATSDLSRLKEPDVISICVPTPLSKTKDPDVSYVLAATNSVKQTLRRGQLV